MNVNEQKSIEQLERLSSMLGAIGETEDYTEVAIKALEEVQLYRAMENRLQNVYGDCPDLLEIVITHLERHEGVDIPEPVFKARLLTDGEVDKWEAYKAIGTVEECRAAVEKKKVKQLEEKINPDFPHIGKMYYCTCGVAYLERGARYCGNCGQKLE